MRRILIILSIIVLLGVGWLVYMTMTKEEPETETSAPLTIRKVLDESTISPIGAYDNNSIWYFNSEGRLFKANIDGTNLSEFPLPAYLNNNLLQVLWPKDGSDFIAIWRDGSSTVKTFFDSATKLFINYPPNVQWIEWLPDGQRVVYVWQSDDKKSQQLILANGDGSGFRTIASVFWPDLVLKVDPLGKTILMYRSNIQGDENKIYAVNLDTGVISTMVDSGRNTAAMWLPLGNKFIYAQGSKIYLYDVLNRQTKDLNLNTSMDKVAVDSGAKTIYAAVAKADKSGDNFVKINVASLKSESYFEPSSSVNVKNMFVVGNTVYYVDRDNKLYRIAK
jgi:hypothetical protein